MFACECERTREREKFMITNWELKNSLINVHKESALPGDGKSERVPVKMLLPLVGAMDVHRKY